jgi:hypothetical protein
MEAGQCPEWRDISDKSYWAQLKSLMVRDGMLEHHWDPADGRMQTAQMAIPSSNVKEILAEMHRGTSGGHLGANKTIYKVQQR